MDRGSTMPRRIVLIESDDFYVEVIGTFVKLFLQQQLVSIKSLGDAQEQIRAAAPDLVLLDLDADGKAALALAESLRDDCDTKRIPILAISHDEGNRDGALGRGCDGFLTKPFKVRELEALIAQLLDVPDLTGA